MALLVSIRKSVVVLFLRSEFVVSPWIKELLTKILELFPLSPELEIIPDNTVYASDEKAKHSTERLLVTVV